MFSCQIRPKVTAIYEVKYLNTLSLESIVSNLKSREMDLNGDEDFKKSKPLALKSVAKIANAS